MLAVMCIITSCSRPGGDSTGSEFMPDMAHSVAYEANYYNYYYNNTWGSEDEYYEFAKPRLPVKGTVPRRQAASISVPSSGDNTPYYYGDTEEERTRAMNELVDNPLPITDAAIANGGVYPVQPAILTNPEFVTASNGRYYHSIMYGKNLMGGYSDKLAYKERWEVIHYIRSLQAKATKTKYDQYTNTLNSVDKPAGELTQVAELVTPEHNDHGHSHDNHEGHDQDDHNHDGHDHDGHDHDDEHHDNH